MTSPRFFYPDTPDLPLPPDHRFPATKYRLLREKIRQEGTLGRASLAASPEAAPGELLIAHDPAYVHAILDGTAGPETMRRIGLPWSRTLADRSLATVGGALAAARAALAFGISGQLAGGTHHAHRAFGSGFCVFNDLAVTALTLIAERAVQRIAIVDLDVHQGDGNAAILGTRPDVFVFSMHGEKNFPFRKVPSHLDVGLPDGTDDAAYMRALAQALPAVVSFRPDLVLYLSGVDPLQADRLGRMAMTPEGLAARDRLVFETFRKRGVPVSIAIGGGYAEPIAASVSAYANTFAVARAVHGL
jgi:acetoin utilization deacetylase AcuC-like enzyme